MSGAGDIMLDYGLTALVSESDSVFLSTQDPASYNDIATNHVADKIGSRGSLFYALSSPGGGGRKASLAPFSDGDITSDGRPNYISIVDGAVGNILFTEALVVPQSVLIGGKFAINAIERYSVRKRKATD